MFNPSILETSERLYLIVWRIGVGDFVSSPPQRRILSMVGDPPYPIAGASRAAGNSRVIVRVDNLVYFVK
jgi:hypothetical protein